MEYLVRYTVHGITMHTIMEMPELARSIGNAEALGRSNHAVWRILPKDEPQRMMWEIYEPHRLVFLYDRYGNMQDSANY